MAEMEITLKVKNEISPVLDKITGNLQQTNKLLAENQTLLEQVIRGSFEVV